MDERELVGLLYRADWTRLSLAGTVRGVNDGVHSIFIETMGPGSGRSWSTSSPPPFTPPFAPPFPPPSSGDAGGERTLVVAPGQRYREEAADGGHASGCDGERVWQWFASLPPETSLQFNDHPRVPFPNLLAPSWLLTGYDLTLEGEVTACGRAGLRVLATARERVAHRVRDSTIAGVVPVPSAFPDVFETWDEAEVVVDVESGILLRCSRRRGAWPSQVTEFLALAVGDAAEVDPARFSAPEGSLTGTRTERGQSLGRDVTRTVAGMAAAGLGAVIRVSSPAQQDPFARATGEQSDLEAEMPDDGPAPDDREGPADSAGAAVSDEVLYLLHRSGAGAPAVTATLHQWFDLAALLEAVPGSARGTGFGGVGFLVDTVLVKARDGGMDGGHEVSRIRVGGWDRYRIDVTVPVRWPERARSKMSDAVRGGRRPGRVSQRTDACDGTRSWQVYDDRVVSGPAEPLPGEIADLLDGSWLLGHELSGGEEVSVGGGRRGYRLVMRKPEPLPDQLGLWLNRGLAAVMGMRAQLFFPAVAVVDAESGRLLRLTRYAGGRAVLRQELRELADLDGPDDFGFTPPDGLRVVERRERNRLHRSDDDDDDDPQFFGPDGRPTSPPDEVRAVVDAVKKQVDAAARGFLGSFLGGPRLVGLSRRGSPGGRRRSRAGLPRPGSGRRAASGRSPCRRTRARPRRRRRSGGRRSRARPRGPAAAR
jgi:hypothetical protein